MEKALQEVDVRVALIQALILLSVEAVEEAFQNEVIGLTGEKRS